MIADYRSTGMTLGSHPMSLLRSGLGPGVTTSSKLRGLKDGCAVEVAGMVVARQRPETAKGVTFMLIEDERGTINLVVPPRVYELFREAVRSAPLVRAKGRMERREGAINVIVTALGAIEQKDRPHQGKRGDPSQERAKAAPEAHEQAKLHRARERVVAELRTVLPTGHSFGRR